MELEPEVKILDRKLDCSLTPPCGAHESHQRAHAESSSGAWSQRGSQGGHDYRLFAVDCWCSTAAGQLEGVGHDRKHRMGGAMLVAMSDVTRDTHISLSTWIIPDSWENRQNDMAHI